jgi:hypothetical protein
MVRGILLKVIIPQGNRRMCGGTAELLCYSMERVTMEEKSISRLSSGRVWISRKSTVKIILC